MKLKIGDEILVTAGKDKGRRGKIERVFPKEGRILVPGLNVYKRHRRGLAGKKGGIIEFSRPLPVSGVAFVCPHCGKQTRVGFKILSGGKVRICRKCKRQIDKKENKL